MFGSTGVGWLYSLANDPPTNWGTVEGFYESVGSAAQTEILIESEVWGRLRSMNTLPKRGDGLAFYHSTRAGFPKRDPYHRRPRISLMGELREIERDGRNIARLSVAVHPLVLREMKRRPIIRDDNTRHLFVHCGIVKGPPATMYFANAQIWQEFISMVRVR